MKQENNILSVIKLNVYVASATRLKAVLFQNRIYATGSKAAIDNGQYNVTRTITR